MFDEKFIKTSTDFDPEFTGMVEAPLFRKYFFVDKIEKATLSVCALGYGYFYLNGKKITEDLFTAPVSNYDKLCWVNEYDVTNFLNEGKNVIAVICGCGFFNENFPSHWKNNNAVWRDNPKFALKLTIGNQIVVKSDESFICSNQSFVIHNQLRSGEIFDARLYDENWKDLNYDDSNWHKAIIDDKLDPEFKVCGCEPIREIETYDFISCRKTEEGYLLDFGVNISGYIRFSADEPKNTVITFRHAEEVYFDGKLKLNGLNVLYPSVDFQTDKYICGEKTYVWSPKFTFHGFRYVLVEGLTKEPVKGSIKAVFVHQDIAKNTKFKCSVDLLNKIYDAGIRSTYSNMFYSLIDCPTREKFGWTNDAQASAEQILINFDSKKFFQKWIEDFKSNMLDDGQLPAIIPTHGYGYGHGPVADGAFFVIPYLIYKYTGDKSTLLDCLPYFIKYYEYFKSETCDERDWLCDWDGYTNHSIDKKFIRAVYTEKLCKIIIFAKTLANNTDIKYYVDERKKAIERLKADYVKNGRSIIDSQTAIAVLICLEIGDKKELIRQLKTKIDASDGHLDCGMFGIQYIYDALSNNGEAEYAYKVITAKGAPSFSNWFDQGATTLWETWRDSGFTDSRNHHMFSNVLAWLFKSLLGIKCSVESPAYKKVDFAPCFISEMDFCKGSLVTPFGLLEVEWEKTNDSIKYVVDLPNGIDGWFNGNKLLSGKNIFYLYRNW